MGARAGNPRRAARLLGAAEGLCAAIQAPLAPDDQELYDRQAAAVRERLGEEAFKSERGRGREMRFERAVEYALGHDDPQ